MQLQVAPIECDFICQSCQTNLSSKQLVYCFNFGLRFHGILCEGCAIELFNWLKTEVDPKLKAFR